MLDILGDKVVTDVTANDGAWTFLCASWSCTRWLGWWTRIWVLNRFYRSFVYSTVVEILLFWGRTWMTNLKNFCYHDFFLFRKIIIYLLQHPHHYFLIVFVFGLVWFSFDLQNLLPFQLVIGVWKLKYFATFIHYSKFGEIKQ